MSLFGKLVKTAVNTVLLPVAIVSDVVTAPFESMDNKKPFTRTPEAIQTLKDEADD